VEDDDEVVAYGMVKLFAEAIMVLDLDRPLRNKADAFKLLIEAAIAKSRDLHMEQLVGFVENRDFANILRKHYGFVNCSGEALVLNL